MRLLRTHYLAEARTVIEASCPSLSTSTVSGISLTLSLPCPPAALVFPRPTPLPLFPLPLPRPWLGGFPCSSTPSTSIRSGAFGAARAPRVPVRPRARPRPPRLAELEAASTSGLSNDRGRATLTRLSSSILRCSVSSAARSSRSRAFLAAASAFSFSASAFSAFSRMNTLILCASLERHSE